MVLLGALGGLNWQKEAKNDFFARKFAKSWQKICGNEKKAVPLHPISKMIR